MIKRDTLVQSTPSTLWHIATPDGSYKGRPLAAYDADGNSLEMDSWQYENNVLTVNFGIDPVAGELEYEYQDDTTDSTTTTVIDDNGNVVNVTINQYPNSESVIQP